MPNTFNDHLPPPFNRTYSVADVRSLDDPFVNAFLDLWQQKAISWGQGMIGACIALHNQSAALHTQVFQLMEAARKLVLRNDDLVDTLSEAYKAIQQQAPSTGRDLLLERIRVQLPLGSVKPNGA